MKQPTSSGRAGELIGAARDGDLRALRRLVEVELADDGQSMARVPIAVMDAAVRFRQRRVVAYLLTVPFEGAPVRWACVALEGLPLRDLEGFIAQHVDLDFSPLLAKAVDLNDLRSLSRLLGLKALGLRLDLCAPVPGYVTESIEGAEHGCLLNFTITRSERHGLRRRSRSGTDVDVRAFNMLVDAGAKGNDDSLMFAARVGNTEMLTVLLQQAEPTTASLQKGLTAALSHFTAGNAARLLLESGARYTAETASWVVERLDCHGYRSQTLAMGLLLDHPEATSEADYQQIVSMLNDSRDPAHRRLVERRGLSTPKRVRGCI